MFNGAHIMASGMRIKLQTTITNAKNPARFQAYIPKEFWTEEQKQIAKEAKAGIESGTTNLLKITGCEAPSMTADSKTSRGSVTI